MVYTIFCTIEWNVLLLCSALLLASFSLFYVSRIFFSFPFFPLIYKSSQQQQQQQQHQKKGGKIEKEEKVSEKFVIRKGKEKKWKISQRKENSFGFYIFFLLCRG